MVTLSTLIILCAFGVCAVMVICSVIFEKAAVVGYVKLKLSDKDSSRIKPNSILESAIIGSCMVIMLCTLISWGVHNSNLKHERAIISKELPKLKMREVDGDVIIEPKY